MTTKQDRRVEAENTISRLTAQREGCIASLIRTEGRLVTARRRLERIKRAQTKALAQQTAKMQAKPDASPPIPVAVAAEIKATAAVIGDGLDIPGFLARKREGERKDREAAAAIRAEQAERKTLKSRGRIAKMKAVQNGDTKRMPLTGRAALAAIRGN